MTRKTVDVGFVLDRANAYLRLTHDDNAEGRMAVAGLVESVLMETGNYKGFGYTDQNGAPVHYVKGETDESRRQYYRHPKLAK